MSRTEKLLTLLPDVCGLDGVCSLGVEFNDEFDSDDDDGLGGGDAPLGIFGLGILFPNGGVCSTTGTSAVERRA